MPDRQAPLDFAARHPMGGLRPTYKCDTCVFVAKVAGRLRSCKREFDGDGGKRVLSDAGRWLRQHRPGGGLVLRGRASRCPTYRLRPAGLSLVFGSENTHREVWRALTAKADDVLTELPELIYWIDRRVIPEVGDDTIWWYRQDAGLPPVMFKRDPKGRFRAAGGELTDVLLAAATGAARLG